MIGMLINLGRRAYIAMDGNIEYFQNELISMECCFHVASEE